MECLEIIGRILIGWLRFLTLTCVGNEEFKSLVNFAISIKLAQDTHHIHYISINDNIISTPYWFAVKSQLALRFAPRNTLKYINITIAWTHCTRRYNRFSQFLLSAKLISIHIVQELRSACLVTLLIIPVQESYWNLFFVINYEHSNYMPAVTLLCLYYHDIAIPIKPIYPQLFLCKL